VAQIGFEARSIVKIQVRYTRDDENNNDADRSPHSVLVYVARSPPGAEIQDMDQSLLDLHFVIRIQGIVEIVDFEFREACLLRHLLRHRATEANRA
jgi:hypothetical protein